MLVTSKAQTQRHLLPQFCPALSTLLHLPSIHSTPTHNDTQSILYI